MSDEAPTVLLLAPKYPPQAGGAAIYFQQLVNELAATRFEPVVFAPETAAHPSDVPIHVDGVHVQRSFPVSGAPIWEGAFCLRRFRHLLRRVAPDVAHVHPHFPQYRYFRWLLKRDGVPRVYDCRDEMFSGRYVRDGAHYLSATRTIDGILQTEVGVSAAQITRSPVVVDVSGREAWDLGNGRHVAFVGDLESHKGLKLAVEAAHGMDDVTLHVVGDGSLREWVTLKAHNSDAVVYHGGQPHARALAVIDASDAVVLPSKSEGRPRVALEALAMQTPVVGTPAGDLGHLIPGSGRVVERTPTAIREGLQAVLAGDVATDADGRDVLTDTRHVRTAAVAAYEQALARSE